MIIDKIWFLKKIAIHKSKQNLEEFYTLIETTLVYEAESTAMNSKFIYAYTYMPWFRYITRITYRILILLEWFELMKMKIIHVINFNSKINPRLSYLCSKIKSMSSLSPTVWRASLSLSLSTPYIRSGFKNSFKPH